MTPVPVRSPLRFYARRGVPVSAQFPSGLPVQRSRDLRLHGGRSRAALLRTLPLLVCASGCSRVLIAGEPHIALSLPTLLLLLLASVVVGLLGGGVVATIHVTSVLRAVDHATAEYHRGEIAKLLLASQDIHDLVSQVIAESHVRIAELRNQFWQLRWGKA